MRYASLVLAVLFMTTPGRSYSVLTHEAIIDTVWNENIKPLLLKRFPAATPDDLLEARAYAYGGCIIQDMGYYPFGDKFFTDLAHYVRSGDFVVSLIRESQDLDEYSFALGAMAHYAADNQGHPVGVNRSVAVEFPKLEQKYGKSVTYVEKPSAHLRVEFGFDVLEVASGNYVPKSYHDFIGFKVSKPVLERAFRDTYSLELSQQFKDLDLALGTYRHAVSSVIPEMTKVAWKMKSKDLQQAHPGLTRRHFIYHLSHASYAHDFDGKFKKPGVGADVLAFLFRIVPKVGPFKFAAVKTPTPETARFFEESFKRTVEMYRGLLADVGRGQLQLPNRDFDTGRPTAPAEYKLADDSYSKLVIELEQRGRPVDAALRTNIVAFFHDLDQPFATKQDPGQWQKTIAALNQLKSTPTTAALRQQ